MTATAPRSPWVGALAALVGLGLSAWRAHRHPRTVARHYAPAGEVLDLPGGPTHVIQGGQPGGAPIVLIHGSDGVALDWPLSPLWEGLAGLGHLIALERPGHGHSPLPPGTPATVALSVERLEQALAHLKVSAPLTLVGHSYGAAVALAFAAAHPGRVRGLVLLSPTAYPARGLTRPLAYLTQVPPIEALLTRVLLLPVGRVVAWIEGRRAFYPAPVPPRWADMMLAFSRRRMQVHALAWENRTLGQELRALARHYPHLKASAAVLVGRLDRLTPHAAHAAPLAAALPNACLHVLEGGGHQVHWTHPGVVLRAVEGVLGGASGR